MSIAAGEREGTRETAAASGEAVVPWYAWAALVAATAAPVGLHWDISYHQAVGRDTFWTPAHLLLYLCGIVGGLAGGWLILATTFGRDTALRAASVTIWGLRGPLGAFVCVWGAVAMLGSAPFDDWWHAAYGLDLKVFTPPHLAIVSGLVVIQAGSLMLVVATMNRRAGRLRATLEGAFLYVTAMVMVTLFTLVWDQTSRMYMHGSRFYLLVVVAASFLVAGVGGSSRGRWPAVVLTACYTIFHLVMLWVLPLVPGEPKLGPVYRAVTHLIPHEFPLLLVVPALCLDLLRPRLSGLGIWGRAAVAGGVFLAVFALVQWPFADFLNSPGARNWFFGADYLGYQVPPTSPYVRHEYASSESAPVFWAGMAGALAMAILLARAGLAWGEWIRRVRR